MSSELSELMKLVKLPKRYVEEGLGNCNPYKNSSQSPRYQSWGVNLMPAYVYSSSYGLKPHHYMFDNKSLQGEI